MKNAKNISVSAAPHPRHKDVTVISVKGFIDTTTAPEFERTFQAALAEGRFKLVIDLKETNYVSSAGWGIFVGEIKRIRNQKGNLFFASMSLEVTEAYELLEFDTILKSFPDVEKAVQIGFGKAAGKAVEAAAAVSPAALSAPVPAAPAAFPVNARIEFAEEEAGSARIPLKSGWLGRILQPWKWF